MVKHEVASDPDREWSAEFGEDWIVGEETFDTCRFASTGELPLVLTFEDGDDLVHKVTIEAEDDEYTIAFPVDSYEIKWRGDEEDRTKIKGNGAQVTFSYEASGWLNSHGIRVKTVSMKGPAKSMYDDGVMVKGEDDSDDEDDDIGAATDHVGWISRAREDAGSLDATDEFHELLKEIRGGTHNLSERTDLVYLVVPGLFCNTYPLYMKGVIKHLKGLGLDASLMSDLNTGASVEDNAAAIAEKAISLNEQTGKRVLLVGHSKGGCDSVAAVSRNAEQLRGKVAGVCCLQAPLGGAPIANDILGSCLKGFTRRVIEHVLRGDMDAFHDLTYERRQAELEEFPFPHDDFPIVTMSTATNRYLSSMQPLAMFFRRKYDGLETDGMVASVDADLPGSKRARFNEDFDHGGCAFPEPGDSACAQYVDEAAILLALRDIPPE